MSRDGRPFLRAHGVHLPGDGTDPFLTAILEPESFIGVIYG